MGSVKESQKAGVEHVVRLLRDTFEFGMLCTVTRDGQLRSRPMTIGRVDDDGDVWFATSIDSPKIAEIQREPHVCVSFALKDKCLTLSGHATVLHAQDVSPTFKLNDRWGIQPEAPDYCLIKISSENGEFWDYSGVMPKLQFLYEASKAYVKGTTPNMGNVGTSERVIIK